MTVDLTGPTLSMTSPNQGFRGNLPSREVSGLRRGASPSSGNTLLLAFPMSGVFLVLQYFDTCRFKLSWTRRCSLLTICGTFCFASLAEELDSFSEEHRLVECFNDITNLPPAVL